MKEHKTFHDVLHDSKALWARYRFDPEWTAERIEQLLRPHVKGFDVRVVRETFDDGVACTLRSADYYETPLHPMSFVRAEDIPREVALFLRGYIGWLRWAAGKLEQQNQEFMAAHPHRSLTKVQRPSEQRSETDPPGRT